MMLPRLIVTIALSICTLPSFSHGIVLWADIINGWVEVTAYDARGIEMKSGDLKIHNLNQHLIKQGKLTPTTRYTFKPAFITDLIISIDTSDQHQHSSEFYLSVDDFYHRHIEFINAIGME